MNGNSIDTLFALLDEYKEVEVPIIQRDYAQGRKDNHSTMVRDNLLADVKLAIMDKNQPLDLNFVYGKAEGDKFIPIDGQQRLTTLFLLHLYAFHDDDSKTGLFHRFTYRTRTTSRKFLEELINNRASVFASKLPPSQEIKDAEWFQSGWECDPTIQSALTMLDDIKEKFKDAVGNLAHSLTDQEYKSISFKFLDMEDLGMEDSLYIKLNARGKPLTPFENFKARLIKRLEQLKHPLKKEFERLLDREWTKLFWTKAGENFDQIYLTFFSILLMNNDFFQDDNNWSNVLNYEKIEGDLFDTAYYTLNFLCANQQSKTYELVFDALENNTYPNKVLFHAVSTYLYLSKGVDDSGSLRQWIRIIRNLTLNTQIDSFDLYRSAIKGINKLAENWNKLLKYFGGNVSLTGFSPEQVTEEQTKAQIILNDDAFAKSLYSAEEHLYFTGQIRSALYYSKNSDGKYNKDDFDYYWARISALFEDAKPKHGNLLRRALLTFGDYTLPISGGYKTLCINNPNEGTSTPSMKRLFSNHGDLVKKLLDSLNPDGDIESQLSEIIKKSAIPKSHWSYCFIGFPSLFDWMSNSHLRLKETDDQMIIIPNKSSRGFNYGLFLAALYVSLKQHGIESSLEGDLGTQVDRYLIVNSLNVRFKKGRFIFEDINKTVVFETGVDNPIDEAIKHLL